MHCGFRDDVPKIKTSFRKFSSKQVQYFNIGDITKEVTKIAKTATNRKNLNIDVKIEISETASLNFIFSFDTFMGRGNN